MSDQTDRPAATLRHEPATLIVSHEAMPTLDRTRDAAASGLAHGAYVAR